MRIKCINTGIDGVGGTYETINQLIDVATRRLHWLAIDSIEREIRNNLDAYGCRIWIVFGDDRQDVMNGQIQVLVNA